MAIRIPNSSGSYLTITTNLNSNAISVFFRVRQHTDRNTNSWLATVGTGATSAWLDTSTAPMGADAQMHGIATATDGNALEGFVHWDWTNPDIGISIDSTTWLNCAIICYGTAAFPKFKFAVRAHPSGTLYTMTRDDASFESTYDGFSNAKIQIGAGAGGSNQSACDFADIWIYNTAYTSDVDIEAQFDTLSAALSGPWASYSMRGKASVSAAAADETNSNDLTVIGSGMTLVDTDNPVFGPYIYGSDSFPTAVTSTAPDAPTGLSLTTLSSSAIKVDWTDNSSDETSFVIEMREAGSEVWSLAGSASADAETLTIYELNPATTYAFRVYASNSGGESSSTAEIEATTLGLFARGYAHQSAAGVGGCTVSVWFEKSTGENQGAEITRGVSGSFDGALVDVGGTQMACITVPIPQVARTVIGNNAPPDSIPILADGDDVQMYVSATVDGIARNTPIFYATVVEE